MKKYIVFLVFISLLFSSFFCTAVFAENGLILRVGLYENQPKIFTDEAGNASGFWPDIIKYIAEKEGWKIEYVPGTWSQSLERLSNNEIDIMPDVAYTDERNKLYSFSTETVYVSWSEVYTRAGTGIESILDLEGKNIAVMKGSVNVEGPEGIKNLVSKFVINCTFTEVDSYMKVFELVGSGEADAGVTSKDFGNLHEADFNIIKTAIVFQPSQLYFAFPKTSTLTPYLTERIDYHIKDLKQDQNSIYYQSLGTWFGVKPLEKPVIPSWILWLLIGIGGIVLVLAVGSYVLRMQVKARTKELTQEIIERKKAEEALRRSEERYKHIFERSPIGICLSSPDGKLIIANKAMQDITGYSAEELVRINLDDAYENTVEKEALIEIIDKLGIVIDYPVRLKRKSGTVYDALLNIATINIDGRDLQHRMQQDITELKRAWEALRASEEKLRAMFESVREGITITDLEGNVVQVNEAVVRLHGYNSKEEMIGRSSLDFIVQKDRARATQDLRLTLEQYGYRRPIEYTLLKKNGTEFPGELRTTTMKDQSNNVMGFVSITEDITERKQAEQDRIQSTRKLLRAMEATIKAMALTVEMRDPYTAGHQRRVTELAIAIAKELKLTEQMINGIRMAAIVHDIGKIQIPAEILSKPTGLTEFEFGIIRNHPLAGFEILKNIEFPWPVAQIVLQHHERMDGSGYPLHISGGKILLEARILAIADVVEAMASHRPYRPALGIGQALEEISKNSGVLYDSKVVEACYNLFYEKGFKLD